MAKPWVEPDEKYSAYEIEYGTWHYEVALRNGLAEHRAIGCARDAVNAFRRHGPCEPEYPAL